MLLENLRPGVPARLGFPWERLRDINPGLVYCAISGFGQSGPMAQRPAHDQIIQGLAGMMSVTGTDPEHPLRAGFPVSDTVGGLAASMAICAALVDRARSGRGHMLDISMLETSVSAMGWAVSNFLVAGAPPRPMGNDNATAAPSGTFPTAGGLWNIAANTQRQFAALCARIDRHELVDDERFATREARKANRAALDQAVAEGLAGRGAAEWEEVLSAAGVPTSGVRRVAEVVGYDQLAAPPPLLGQHTEEVLGELAVPAGPEAPWGARA